MFSITIHFDNARGFDQPTLRVSYAASPTIDLFPPSRSDGFGPVFQIDARRPEFKFRFQDGAASDARAEDDAFERAYRPVKGAAGEPVLQEVWCVAAKAFVYPVSPRLPDARPAAEVLSWLPFKPGHYVPGTGGFSGIGAHVLDDGRVLFGLYHPNAARVYVAGSFNDWQRPSHPTPDPSRFVELTLHPGYFGSPNLWLGTATAAPGDEYKFFVVGGVPSDDHNRLQQHFTDPFARRLGPDYGFNNSVVVDASTFAWSTAWKTPDMSDLILYELSVYGFTEGDPDIALEEHGKFDGITSRIRSGYFSELGVTALSLMPLAEVPSPQGARSLGYDPSIFAGVERDFGAPDDLRRLVDTAHQHGLAVVLDQVFNHTSSTFNPLWQLVLEHPDEQIHGEGGLYFSGATRWGNRVATEKEDVQNLLIDACKLWLTEYRVDGFRFDATHRWYMDHGFVQRLRIELQGYKPDVLLIAENLPNDPTLNGEGPNGYAQWCDSFHDRLKALLREGPFDDRPPDPYSLGSIFYFAKDVFAAHTNNVVNYTENHDETSIPYEVGTNPVLDHPAAKDRKGRLALFSTIVALGQPMIYMGQEFNVERDRNFVSVEWPHPVSSSGFYEWARRLIHLRRRYPGLRMSGFDPAAEGRFTWVLAPWMDGRQGGGRAVIGWRAVPNDRPFDTLLVMLNFEGSEVTVDVPFGRAGRWVKLADIDRVDDVPPAGTNSAQGEMALETADGLFAGFQLPSSSGFIYKWEAAL